MDVHGENTFTLPGVFQKQEMKLKEFVKRYGDPYSGMLGIDLRSRKNEQIVKWFLASILYGKPIRESTATMTYRVFESEGVLTPPKILKMGWEGLVSLLDEGGYTRYDFSTAERLLEIFGNLERRYGGDLNRLHASAFDSVDLERRIRELGRGIGDTTLSIFLRDMRETWDKADPRPSKYVKLSMDRLKTNDLKRFSRTKGIDIVRLETALMRLGRDFVRKGKKLELLRE